MKRKMAVLAGVFTLGLTAVQAGAAEPPAVSPAAFEARMKASAQAAQALQGPWDGTWILSGAHGHRLFVFQITDPADGGPLAGAWREAGGAGRTGWIDAITRHGRELELSFTPAGQGATTEIRLERRETGSATGWMATTRSKRRVRLSRGL
jgi:hypothetical protein